MMQYGYYGNHAGLFGLGWIFMIFVWVLIILAVVALLKWATGHHESHSGEAEKKPTDSAMDIIRERYAKGEINKEEFEQKKKDLSS